MCLSCFKWVFYSDELVVFCPVALFLKFYIWLTCCQTLFCSPLFIVPPSFFWLVLFETFCPLFEIRTLTKMAIYQFCPICTTESNIDSQSTLLPNQARWDPRRVICVTIFLHSHFITVTNKTPTINWYVYKNHRLNKHIDLAVAVMTWSHWATCLCISTEPVYHGKDWRYE